MADPASASRAALIACGRSIGACEVRGPVRLPCAVVVRERLLPACMIMVDLAPEVAHLDRAAFVLIERVELAAIAREAAYGRHWIELAERAVDPVDRPLP